MNTLLHYDLLRLEAFQNNIAVQNSIAISKTGELTLLKFKPIHYFNYCIGKVNSVEALHFIKNFYGDIAENKHQILIDSSDLLSRDILQESSEYSLSEKISIMKLIPEETSDYTICKDVKLVAVTEKNIKEFAWLYLSCFEAENRHEESVEENFRLKLKVDGLRFYFIHYKGKAIGITGLYFHPEFTILSVGAVLKDFRLLGVHKSALSWRILQSMKIQGAKPIYSWAYTDSISYQNMLKKGMAVSQELLVYQHAG